MRRAGPPVDSGAGNEDAIEKYICQDVSYTVSLSDESRFHGSTTPSVRLRMIFTVSVAF